MSTLSLRNAVQPSRRYDAQPRCRVFSVSSTSTAMSNRESSVRLMSARSVASVRICAAASSTEVDPPVAEPIVPAQNPAANKKLRIRLKSFDVEPMKEAVQMILDAANQTGARVAGPVPLPTKKRLYCVLRSPHVDKDSREHFQMHIHSRLIDIRDMTSDTIDQLMELDIPAGVEANIKIL